MPLLESWTLALTCSLKSRLSDKGFFSALVSGGAQSFADKILLPSLLRCAVCTHVFIVYEFHTVLQSEITQLLMSFLA